MSVIDSSSSCSGRSSSGSSSCSGRSSSSSSGSSSSSCSGSSSGSTGSSNKFTDLFRILFNIANMQIRNLICEIY